MKRICMLLIFSIFIVGCSRKQPSQQPAEQSQQSSEQVTATSAPSQAQASASPADFAKNWASSEATKKWADHGLFVATGGEKNDLLVVYFNRENADIAAQMMSPNSASADFSQMIAHAGFKNVLGLQLPPGQKPGPSFTEKEVAYTGTVSQDGVKWSSAQAGSAGATGATVQDVSIDGLYPGMDWQEARATSSFKHATCTNGGGNTMGERISTKSCRIVHEAEGDEGNTYLMFYRNRLYLIVSNYRFERRQAELKRVFGRPKESPAFSQTSCWYREGISYQVAEDETAPPQITVVDFNVAPSSVQAQRAADPVCRGRSN